MDTNDIIRKLHNINWNFDFNINYSSDSLYPFDCRKHYSYPATFIPEIPYTLIEILSCKGDTVLDPFGGIGTTFIQALLLERNPISCDINPIATNVCSALYELFDPDLDREVLKQQLLSFCDNYDGNIDYTINTTEQQKELDGWYEKDTFKERARIPRDVIGKFGLTVGLFCQGIILSNGPQIDPGFNGTLFCLLFNTSNQAVHLKRGMHYATIEFNKLIEPAPPYKGSYQDKTKIIDYIPANALHGAINELKKEIEQLKKESKLMQNIYLAVVGIMFAILSILLVLR